jgi:Ca-activated chloride channel family protein
LVLVTLIAVLLASCGLIGSDGNSDGGDGRSGGDSSTSQQPPANALAISLAYSPEKEVWLQEQIALFNAQAIEVQGQPVFVTGTNVSSGKARTEIKEGRLATTAWSPSASTWLEVLKQETGNTNVAISNKPLVMTPVVISMWRPMAEALGWPEKAIGWSDMLELINASDGWGKFGHPEWGKFSWGHTDPEISTSALSTLIAEFYAATGKQRGLTVGDVQAEKSQQFIRDLGQGIKHYGYNTLVFSENMRKFGLSYISAFPMEEITLIEFNKSNPPTPLVAIYPKEGTFWHDNPFIIMASASAAEQEAAEQFYEFLLTDASQQKAMSYGFRPANPSVTLADPISKNYGVDPQGVESTLEVPDANVIVAIKDSWKQNRKRADIVIVVDVSGSMDGEKLQMVKAGLESFLMRMLPEDRVGLVTFANQSEMVVPLEPLEDNRIALQEAIQAMYADGGTAMNDALEDAGIALKELEKPKDGEERIRAIVLLSDGEDNASNTTLDELDQQFYESGISIFPVAYGTDANMGALDRIADFSRTIVVQGSTGDIAQIFENLSRYF